MEEFQHPVSTLYSASTEFEFRYLEVDVRVIRSRQGNETSARGMHRPTSTFVVCAQREKEKKRKKEIEKRKKGEIPMTHRRGDTKAEKKKRRKIYIYIYISVEIPATMTSFRSDIHRLVSMDPLLCRSRLSNDPVRTIPSNVNRTTSIGVSDVAACVAEVGAGRSARIMDGGSTCNSKPRIVIHGARVRESWRNEAKIDFRYPCYRTSPPGLREN